MKQNIFLLIIVALLMLALISCTEDSTSPNNYILEGIIKSSEDSSLLEDVKVHVVNNFIDDITYTDENGKFLFSVNNLEGTGVDLYFEKVNYNPKWRGNAYFSTDPSSYTYYLDPAEWTGKIYGDVRESGYGNVSNAQVKLYRIAFETLVSQTYSDYNGYYEFEDIPTGFYRLEAYHEEFGEGATSVTISSDGEEISCDLFLE